MNLSTSEHHHHLNYVYGFQLKMSWTVLKYADTTVCNGLKLFCFFKDQDKKRTLNNAHYELSKTLHVQQITEKCKPVWNGNEQYLDIFAKLD